jgi:cell wall-associated NlpC family hydrolase
MKTGWVKVKGLWYYLAANGQMKTGWVTDGGKKYYLTAGGAMKTGWLKIGGKTYYLTSSGAMKTGWLQVGGKKYYFDTNGVLNEEKTKEANGEVTDASKKAESGTAQSVQQSTVAKTKGEMVASYALQFVGNPYVYGGCSLTKGTDCSGFVMLIYRHFGVNLPHYDAAIRTKGKSVPSLQEAKAGDIICYYGHVAIYLGDGRIVHASNSRDGIKISERADYRTIAGIRRIFD